MNIIAFSTGRSEVTVFLTGFQCLAQDRRHLSCETYRAKGMNFTLDLDTVIIYFFKYFYFYYTL